MNLIFIIAITVLIFSGCNTTEISSEKNRITKPAIIDSAKLFAHHQNQIDSIKLILKETDIIFRGGTDIEIETIREFSEKDKLFSHCGIVIFKDSQLVVAHMIGGVSNPIGGIMFDPIEKFLSYPANESCGIYGIRFNVKEKKKLYSVVDSIEKKNPGFDLKFDLFSKDDLYCTEFLIDVIENSKNDTTLFNAKRYNLKNTKYFFLANKGSDFYFYPIDVFQHNGFLKLKRYIAFSVLGFLVLSGNRRSRPIRFSKSYRSFSKS